MKYSARENEETKKKKRKKRQEQGKRTMNERKGKIYEYVGAGRNQRKY